MQQLPAWHPPPQHLFPDPHWASVVQALQEWLVHSPPVPQSVFTQHVPVKQAPLQQTPFVPQSASMPQLLQVLFWQNWPLVHCALVQQLPGVHRNPPPTSQHLAPRPHWKSLVHEPQWLFPHTYPAVVQSLFWQQLPAKH